MVILRKPEVAARMGVSARTIDRMEKAGMFPSRIRIGAKLVGWRSTDIEAWLNELN